MKGDMEISRGARNMGTDKDVMSPAEELEDLPGMYKFDVCYWNGGGGLLKRLKVNPALRKLLDKNPDIFVYGESGMSTKRGLFLKDYIFIFHRSYIKAADKHRRGLVIFYLKKYQHLISKVYSSNIFEIV